VAIIDNSLSEPSAIFSVRGIGVAVMVRISLRPRIFNMAESLKSLMKNAHIRIAHGQMPTHELEQIMSDFYHGRFQILIVSSSHSLTKV
jgi:reverse gyrase